MKGVRYAVEARLVVPSPAKFSETLHIIEASRKPTVLTQVKALCGRQFEVHDSDASMAKIAYRRRPGLFLCMKCINTNAARNGGVQEF